MVTAAGGIAAAMAAGRRRLVVGEDHADGAGRLRVDGLLLEGAGAAVDERDLARDVVCRSASQPSVPGVACRRRREHHGRR